MNLMSNSGKHRIYAIFYGFVALMLTLAPFGYQTITNKKVTYNQALANGQACENQTMYAIHDKGLDDSIFFNLPLNTGVTEQIGPERDEYDIEAIDTHPVTGLIYGLSGDTSDPASNKKLLIIDKTTGIPDLSTGVQLDISQGQEYKGASFNPNTNELWATGDGDLNLRVINLSDGTSEVRKEISGSPEALAWDLAGDYLYILYQNGSLKRYQASSGDITTMCTDMGDIEGMEFDLNGNLIIGYNSTTNSFNIDVFNPNTCQTEQTQTYNTDLYDIETMTFACEEQTYCELELVKEDFVDSVAPGDTLDYRLTLTNTGTGDCTGGGVKLRDYFDEDTEYVSSDIDPSNTTNDYIEWNFGTMTPGEVEVVNVTVDVSDDAACDSDLLNKSKYWSNETNWGDWVNEETPVVCGPACGDGNLDQGEQCDDGNQVNGDGCSSTCQIEQNLCQNEVMYDVVELTTDDSSFYKYDVNSKVTTQIGNQRDNYSIKGSDIDPQTGIIYGFTGKQNDPASKKRLVQIDKITGIPLYTSGVQLDLTSGERYKSASFNPITNELWAAGANTDLRTVNLSNGTSVIKKNLSGSPMGLAWDLVGENLYIMYQNDHLDKYNTTTGDITTVCSSIDNFESLEFDVYGNLVVGYHDNPNGSGIDIFNLNTCQPVHSSMYDFPYSEVETMNFECEDNKSFCGDGIKQSPNDEGTGGPNDDGYEDCDGSDGVGEHQTCTNQCILEDLTYCGDGIKQSPNDEGTGGPNDDGYEDCDGTDGVGANETCSNSCELIYLPYCGDGNLDQGEQCDDGNNDNGDGCNSQCEIEYASISGCKYKDLNNNGVIDAGEPTVAQWPILLTDSQLGFASPIATTTTDVDGCYEFNGLDAGEYWVGEGEIPGWTQTYPTSPNYHVVNVNLNDNIQNIDFANYQEPIIEPFCGDGNLDPGEQCDDGNLTNGDGCSDQCLLETTTISGCKYNDADNSGTIDQDELTLSGWTIVLNDLDDASSTPQEVVTGENGCYEFTGVGFGNYALSETLQNGWLQTYPTNPSTHSVTVDSVDPYENYDFANFQEEVIEPFCGDGNVDPGEQCDDGNNVNGDGCSAQCVIETPPPCVGSCGGGGGPVNPEIRLTKTAGVAFTNKGGIVDYTIEITNVGRGTGRDLVVTDTLPAGLSYYATTTAGVWDLGDILRNETKTLTYQVKFADDVAVGNYTNTAVAEISNGNSSEDDATVEVRDITVYSEEYSPLLAIEKNVNMEFTNPGGEVTYTVTVTNTNTGNLVANNVVVTDRLPKEFYFNSNSADVNSWDFGDMQPQETKTISFEVTVKQDTKNGSYDNWAFARADNAPEVSDSVPMEVREVTTAGFELPDTDGSMNSILSIILGTLFLAAGYLFAKLRKQYQLA